MYACLFLLSIRVHNRRKRDLVVWTVALENEEGGALRSLYTCHRPIQAFGMINSCVFSVLYHSQLRSSQARFERSVLTVQLT